MIGIESPIFLYALSKASKAFMDLEAIYESPKASAAWSQNSVKYGSSIASEKYHDIKEDGTSNRATGRVVERSPRSCGLIGVVCQQWDRKSGPRGRRKQKMVKSLHYWISAIGNHTQFGLMTSAKQQRIMKVTITRCWNYSPRDIA